MIYSILADSVFVLHLCFVLFVIFGGLLVLRKRWILWLHIPAVVWAILVEFLQLFCPLTTLEIRLKQLGGERGYEGGFIEYYASAILYAHVTPQIQIFLGVLVILINLGIYWYIFRYSRRLN